MGSNLKYFTSGTIFIDSFSPTLIDEWILHRIFHFMNLTAIFKNFQMQLLFMGIIVHARIKDGIIKTDEDLKKLGMEGEKVILEIRRSKIDEIEKRLVQSKKELIDESIEMTEYGVDIE